MRAATMLLALFGFLATSIPIHAQKGPTSPRVDPDTFAREWLEAWNSRDVDRILTFYAEDAVYEDVAVVSNGWGEPWSGHETIREALVDGFEAIPDMSFENVSVSSVGDRLAVEWIMTGTHLGDYPGLPATGRSISIRGVSLIELEGDEIAWERDYYDAYLMLTQLGAVPALDAAGASAERTQTSTEENEEADSTARVHAAIATVALVASAMLAGSASAGPMPVPGEDPARTPLAEALRNRVEAAAALPERLYVDGDRVQTAAGLATFYERRSYEPAWVTQDGLRPAARRLVETLAQSRRDGLDPGDYHVPEIREQMAELRTRESAPADTGRLVDLELLLTDGFLLYGSHLLTGRLDAATLHANWRAERRERDMVTMLEEAVADDDPRATLQDLRPPQPGYARLMDALAAYRELAAGAGWSSVADGPRLAPGDSSERVPALRARLMRVPEAVTGESGPPDLRSPEHSLVYDSALAEAVRDFQRRHGLEPDAVVGSGTLASLNATPAERVRQIEVNLERWRWLPQELGDRHVLVNAADFRLEAVDGGETQLTMRAIVGRPYRQTPVFSDRITYMVFSPYWHVPHSLAVGDQLPLQKKDSGYFRRMGFRLFRGWGADAAEVDPSSVDWGSVSSRNFGFRLRQDPGPQNFLGAVKFMFPNPWNVYLHDTPGRDLFAKTTRSFSSGCIRLEKSRELALWLLSGQPAWTSDRVDRAMKAGREETARLADPVAVHLLYWTAFADDEGGVQFRPDVYDRDAPVARALERAPPGETTPAGSGVGRSGP